MKPFILSAITMKNLVLKKLNCIFNPFSMMLCILALGFASPGVWADDMPDICSIVPGVLQTNNYHNGKPFAGTLDVSGTGNKIILPYDETEMSLTSTSSKDCYYPSNINGAGVDCKIDPDKVIDGYPYVLSENTSDENLYVDSGTILDEGEYWYDTISFSGDGAKLKINGEVIIHYNQMDIPTGSGTVYINSDGDSKNLLFIGHGGHAEVVTEDESMAIHANAHFYIDNASPAGLSLGGSNSEFNGGLSANYVSLSGTDNTFNGSGGCAPPEPEPEPEDDDLCTYFPGGLQGNVYDSNGISVVLDISDGNASGGNRVYLDDDGLLGFAKANNTITAPTTGDPASGCVYKSEGGSFPADAHGKSQTHDATECIVDPTDDAFSGAPPQTPHFSAFDPQYGDIVGVDGGTYTVEHEGYYNSLTTGMNGGKIIFPAGTYWIDTLNITNNNDAIETAGDGTVIIHYNTIKFSGNTHYINANPINNESGRVQNAEIVPDRISSIKSDEYSPRNLMLIGHGDDAGVTVDNSINETFINALWYISPSSVTGVSMTGAQRFQLSGALSAPIVTITGDNSASYIYTIPSVACPPDNGDDTYTIDIDIDKNIALTCQVPVATITVTNQDGDPYQGDVNVKIDPSSEVTLGEPSPSPENGTSLGDGIYTTNSDGEIKIPLESDGATYDKTYTVTATLVNEEADAASDSIEYVPFAFEAEDQQVVANKPQSVEVKALACDSGEEVAVNYDGKPEATYPSDEPAGGAGELIFDPDFSSDNDNGPGTTSADLTFTDSGQLTVTITDDNFKCTSDQEGCPYTDEEGSSTAMMKGSFTVYSRPWTFAICDAEGSPMDGTIHDAASRGYKAAGQEFDLHIRPLRWVSGETDPVAGAEKIDVTELCDKPITQNYLSSGSPDSTIQLSYELAQPSPDVGNKGSLTGTQSLANTKSKGSGDGGYYDFSQLAWSEVGVLTVKIDTPEDEKYYGMNINQGYRNIGRFYPDHLSILENAWTYAEGQDAEGQDAEDHTGFAYMNQPVGMSYTVEARNVDDSPTQNYGYFNGSLQAQVKVVGVDEDNQSLASRFYVGDEGTDVGWSSVKPISDRNAQYVYSTGNFEFYKLTEDDDPYTSTPDGPFSEDNSTWGMEVTDSTVDQVNFDFNDNDNSFTVDTLNEKAMAFSEKPNFRYGRMVLDSVSSPIGGPVSVPLRAEYWDGEIYVVNEDDNGSKFKTSVYCAVDEDSGEPSSASLTDTDNDTVEHSVDEGKSSIVQAKQSEAKRETARIFLRQGSDNGGGSNNKVPADVDCEWNGVTSFSQPWLQFNWRNKGDEDPSTVVTFGAYRGNDRIIFRGEEQLTEN